MRYADREAQWRTAERVERTRKMGETGRREKKCTCVEEKKSEEKLEGEEKRTGERILSSPWFRIRVTSRSHRCAKCPRSLMSNITTPVTTRKLSRFLIHFFPLFADRYIACRPFDVIIPFTLGVHIFPTPDVPTARDNNRTDLVAHRSSTTIRSVLVTRRYDALTRSLSPRFFPG
ncbi:hypothetical protein ALC53_12478 [Atta colombica]|uniref:Uncharacterized protein n=1 Tax=Atta colombica TaxID=520822 RepID=A0A195AY60_9HYME|nr:hypothetical protein ALC53_12478 [Atta colombica]